MVLVFQSGDKVTFAMPSCMLQGNMWKAEKERDVSWLVINGSFGDPGKQYLDLSLWCMDVFLLSGQSNNDI